MIENRSAKLMLYEGTQQRQSWDGTQRTNSAWKSSFCAASRTRCRWSCRSTSSLPDVVQVQQTECEEERKGVVVSDTEAGNFTWSVAGESGWWYLYTALVDQPRCSQGQHWFLILKPAAIALCYCWSLIYRSVRSRKGKALACNGT